MNLLVSTMDWVFIVFHLALFIWACVLYFRYSNSCSLMWDFWVFIYIIFGFVASAALICAVFMGVFRSLNKRRYEETNPDHDKIHHPEDYVYTDLQDKELIPY